jgi:hypothetical protein
MPFRCPVCDGEVRVSDKACPHCKEPLDAASFIKRLFVFTYNRASALRCPVCNFSGRPERGCCVYCGSNFTLAAALAPPIRWWNKKPLRYWRKLRPVTRRRLHFYSSAAFLWFALGWAADHETDLAAVSLLSIAYLAVLLLFVVFVVPRDKRINFTTGIPPLTKISLSFNYFAFLIFLQGVLLTWARRAAVLGGLFFMSWAACWLFLEYIYPIACVMADIITGHPGFDPTADQTRNVHNN